MADMLRSFVRGEVQRQIREKYPYIQHPSGMCAKIVQVKANDGKYTYTLRMLDEFMNIDDNLPEIPDVNTELELKKGDTVAVLLLYGGNMPFILGRWKG